MQKMRYVGSILLIAIALSGTTGCNPAPAKSESSTIRIQTPSRNKVGALAFPVGSTICYGVNITGSGIPLETGCHPAYGITAGFAGENSTLQIDGVPYGSNRRLELFAYLYPTGSGSCPTSFASGFAAANIASVYYVGGAPSFSISSPETNLTISANFPGVANSVLTTTVSLQSCSGVAPLLPNENNFFVGSSAGVAVDGTIKMRARVGRAVDAPVLMNGNIKLQVK